jgi:hypothetical protein
MFRAGCVRDGLGSKGRMEMTATAKRWKDKEWRYVRSEATDLHATFRRIRRQMKEAEAAKKPAAKVTPLKKEKKA